MSRFPSEHHLASWAKLCPGTNESAGKRSNASTGRGTRSLRTASVEAAHAAGRERGTYLHADSHRPAGQQEGGGCRRPQHLDHRLPHPARRRGLRRPGGRLPRASQSGSGEATSGAAAGGARL
ncbi:MAG: transposase [Chloroflexi bacterium]|nr:transposase [Chloroflexota bacterium]